MPLRKFGIEAVLLQDKKELGRSLNSPREDISCAQFLLNSRWRGLGSSPCQVRSRDFG